MSALLDLSLPMLPDQYYHIYNRGNEKRNIFFNPDNYRFFLKRYGEYMSPYFDTYTYCLLQNHFHLLVKPKTIDEVFAAAIKDFDYIDSLFCGRYAVPWLKAKALTKPETGDLTVLIPDLSEAQKLNLSSSFNLMNEELLNQSSHEAQKLSSSLKLLNEELLDRPTSPRFLLKPMLNLLAHEPQHHIDLSQITRLDQLDFKTQLCSHIVSERFRRFMLSYAKSINKAENRTGSLMQKAFRRKRIGSLDYLKRCATYIHHNVIHHGYAYHYEVYPWSSYSTIISDGNTKLNRNELLSWFGGKDEFIAYAEQYKKYKWEKENFYIEVE